MSAPTILSINTILQCAKLAQGYAAIDRAKKNALFGGLPDETIPEKIYLVRKSVQNRFDKNSTDTTLRDTANLLWSLCGIYGIQALNNLGLGGGTVIQFNNGGTVVNVSFFEIQFTVGDGSTAVPSGFSIMNNGDTTYSIPYPIMPGSMSILRQDSNVDLYPSNDFNYLAVYGTPASPVTNITFSAGVSALEKMKFQFVRILT